MKNIKKYLWIVGVVIVAILLTIMWVKMKQAQKQKVRAQQEVRKSKIAQDSLRKLSDGHYQLLVADTLTSRQLRKRIDSVIELNGRIPKSITETVILPIEVIKYVDSTKITKDSIYIEDYYPKKENSFLKYTSRISLSTQEGKSKFTFSPITLTQVVSKKNDGLYEIDFKGPDFIEVKSLSLQTEPIEEPKKDNFGILVGADYVRGINDTQQNIDFNTYLRFKKVYIGGGFRTDNTIKGGLKIEF